VLFKYATEPNLAKYRPLLVSDYAKKYIKSETLMKLLQLAPDVLRLIRFTPAQVKTLEIKIGKIDLLFRLQRPLPII